MHMPDSLKDCVLVPVPKQGKDPTCVDGFRLIALTTTLNRPSLERERERGDRLPRFKQKSWPKF